MGDKIRYGGIDLSDSFIYKQESRDSRIIYTSLDNIKSMLEAEEGFDLIAIIDVLEHNRRFSNFFELAMPQSKRFILVSMPNKLFIAERIRMLARRELRAHSLTLPNHQEGFKHKFIVNVNKARSILKEGAQQRGFE